MEILWVRSGKQRWYQDIFNTSRFAQCWMTWQFWKHPLGRSSKFTIQMQWILCHQNTAMCTYLVCLSPGESWILYNIKTIVSNVSWDLKDARKSTKKKDLSSVSLERIRDNKSLDFHILEDTMPGSHFTVIWLWNTTVPWHDGWLVGPFNLSKAINTDFTAVLYDMYRSSCRGQHYA